MKRWIKHAIFGMSLGGCLQQEATPAPTIESAEATTCPDKGNYTKVDPLKAEKWAGQKLMTPVGAYQHWMTIPDLRTDGMSIAALVDVDKGVVVQAVTFSSNDLYKVHAAVPDQPWTDHFRPPPPPPPPIGDKFMTAVLLEVGLMDHVSMTVGLSHVGIPQGS